jgi:membrane-bound lytic murein transglycosylase A
VIRQRILAAFLVGWVLAGCATEAPRRAAPVAPPPPVVQAPPAPAPLPPAPPAALGADTGPLSQLPGWAQEDYAAALRAFAATCHVARDAAMASVCRRARAAGPLDEAAARAFLEANFRPEPAAAVGLLTAYFSPVYEARAMPGDEFAAPVRPRPADLPRSAGAAYADRATIEARPADDALAWMRPEDLFFLQIQGSGVLVFPDGSARAAVFDGSNGLPFVGIAAPMRRRGLLADSESSGDAIRAWLAANRGPAADAVMRLDPRYVFFKLIDDDGAEAVGAAGVRLVPGRSIAVDPAWHAMGEVVWLNAESPALSGAFPAYRRLAMALDTGGAIKGEARADLYLGRGAAAGAEASRVRHVLRLYRLAPAESPDP